MGVGAVASDGGDSASGDVNSGPGPSGEGSIGACASGAPEPSAAWLVPVPRGLGPSGLGTGGVVVVFAGVSGAAAELVRERVTSVASGALSSESLSSPAEPDSLSVSSAWEGRRDMPPKIMYTT
jgi:hypothetical protein